MAWRSVVITQPARLRLEQRALIVSQEEGTVRLPLEDISVLVIDQPQVNLTAQLLSALAEKQIAVITVGEDHHPNGVLLPFLPHSRALKVMKAQLSFSTPKRKRLWQTIIRQKIVNQSSVLQQQGNVSASERLLALSREVLSGDSDNREAEAAQFYFRHLFGHHFTRTQDRIHNAAMNYGYSIIRSALARNLVAYGFLPAFGLHHRNEQNPFNLADDLIEPFRPLLDAHVLKYFALDEERPLNRLDKAALVNFMHQDVSLVHPHKKLGASSVLAATEAIVISLSQRLNEDSSALTLPSFLSSDSKTVTEEDE